MSHDSRCLYYYKPEDIYVSPVKTLLFSPYISNNSVSPDCSRLTTPHLDAADVLLPQEVPDLHHGAVLLDDHVDGEMGIHGAHFVPETLQTGARAAVNQSVKGKQNPPFYQQYPATGQVIGYTNPREVAEQRAPFIASQHCCILTKVTPLIMFWTWLQMVRTVASSFLFPHHLSTRS